MVDFDIEHAMRFARFLASKTPSVDASELVADAWLLAQTNANATVETLVRWVWKDTNKYNRVRACSSLNGWDAPASEGDTHLEVSDWIGRLANDSVDATILEGLAIGQTYSEIAACLNVSKQAIHKRVEKYRTILVDA